MVGQPAKSIQDQIRPTNVSHGGKRGYANTDELRLAKYMGKALNVAHMDYPAFAYYFVSHSPGIVIRNMFKLFEAVVQVMANKLDNNDINDNDELAVAIASKRIIDALEVYK